MKPATLPEMLAASVRKFPDKTAIAGVDSSLSFAELQERSGALGRFLVRSGVARGDRVALFMRKRPEAIVAFFGVAIAGGVAFTLDYNASPENLARILAVGRPRIVIVEERYAEALITVLGPGTSVRLLVLGAEGAAENGWNWDEAVADRGAAPCMPVLSAEDPVYLNLTSGSSGLPKAVGTTHANLFWNTLGAVQALRLTSDDVHLCLFPIFGHPHEIFVRAIFLGGTTVLLDSLLPSAIAAAVQRHGVTTTMAASTIYQTILNAPNLDAEAFATVRIAECGGMHLSPVVFEQFRERFNVRIVPVWGSTETSGIAFAADLEEAYIPGSVGRPCPDYEARLLDETGRLCDPDEVGELCLRGPGVCASYSMEGGFAASLLCQGWFHTGDLFRRDARGFFFFSGRKTGMLKVAGMRVYPTELEDLLSAHPEVSEVAVCATDHPTRGEVPMAVVVLREGAQAGARELRAYCESHLPPYKVPKVFDFRPALPKSAGGKILYSKLKAP